MNRKPLLVVLLGIIVGTGVVVTGCSSKMQDGKTSSGGGMMEGDAMSPAKPMTDGKVSGTMSGDKMEKMPADK